MRALGLVSRALLPKSRVLAEGGELNGCPLAILNLHASPLREIQDWVAFYSKFWGTNMLRLNRLLEEEAE